MPIISAGKPYTNISRHPHTASTSSQPSLPRFILKLPRKFGVVSSLQVRTCISTEETYKKSPYISKEETYISAEETLYLCRRALHLRKRALRKHFETPTHLIAAKEPSTNISRHPHTSSQQKSPPQTFRDTHTPHRSLLCPALLWSVCSNLVPSAKETYNFISKRDL